MIYDLLATIIYCLTLIVIVYLFVRTPIKINFTKKIELPKQEPVQEPKKEDTTESEKQVNKNVAAASMDAVIKAANELMGIETIDKETSNGRED